MIRYGSVLEDYLDKQRIKIFEQNANSTLHKRPIGLAGCEGYWRYIVKSYSRSAKVD
jgi:hypothetical protein